MFVGTKSMVVGTKTIGCGNKKTYDWEQKKYGL
jgi:hypothetical protein